MGGSDGDVPWDAGLLDISCPTDLAKSYHAIGWASSRQLKRPSDDDDLMGRQIFASGIACGMVHVIDGCFFDSLVC